MITHVPTGAQGHAGIVDSAFSRALFLTAGGEPVRTPFVIAAGQVLEPGTVLGFVDATATLVVSDPTAGDGSEAPFAIILEAIDTSASGTNADTEMSVLHFSNRVINFDALVYDANWAPRTLQRELMRAGISTRTPFYSGQL